MKKNNALMISYIIFLAITLAANVLFEWDGLERIALGATVAGVFFAFSDLFNWRVTYNNYYCDRMKKANEYLDSIFEDEIDYLDNRDEEFEKILKRANPYIGKNINFDNLIDCIIELNEKDKTTIEKYEQNLLETDDVYKNIEKEREKNNKFEMIELWLMIAGYVCFFNILVFDCFVLILNGFQIIATIIAFIAIMINYYSKESIEEKKKIEFDNIIKKAERTKSELETINQDFDKLNLLREVDSFIETLKVDQD